MSISLFFFLVVRSFALHFRDHLCGPQLRTLHASAGRVLKFHEWQYNIFVRLSVSLVVRGPFTIFIFVFISSVGVQCHDEFIPTLESGGPQWSLVELICLYLFISVWSSA